MVTSEKWKLFVQYGMHNQYIHAKAAKLTEIQLKQTKQFRKSRMALRNILGFFR